MEKFVTIQQQFPMQERAYTDRNGQNQVFASMGFVLSDGIDTFYAEMQGDLARANQHVVFDKAYSHSLQAQLSVRSWKDKQGVDRYSTECHIIKLV